MLYYGNVRIKTTKKGYKAFKNEIEKYIKDNDNLFENLLKFAKIKEADGIITIDWKNLKWTEDIKVITNSLRKIKEQRFSWTFARIGEDYEDIEFERNIQDYNLYDILDIHIYRSFEC